MAVVIIFPLSSYAQKKPSPKSKFLLFHAGYFNASRETFRDIYDGRINLELGYERNLSERLYWGFELGFKNLDAGDIHLKYRCYYLSSSTAFAISNNPFWKIRLRTGLGYSLRTISSDDLPIIGPDGGVYGYINETFTDWAPMLFVGGDIFKHTGKGFYIGGSFVLDYYYDPHPETGDFGNTGGYNFRFIIRQKIG